MANITITNSKISDFYFKNKTLSGDLLILDKEVVNIPDETFWNCTIDLDQIYYKGSLEDWCKIKFNGAFANPLIINPEEKKTLCFGYDGSNESSLNPISDLVIPESITEILPYSFYCLGGENKTLKSITIHSKVSKIGKHAFEPLDDGLYIDLYIPDLEAWCNIDFDIDYDYNYEERSISVQANPMSFAKTVYINGKPSTSIVIPNSITKIKDSTFSRFAKLQQITFHDNIECIGKSAFEGCTGLTSITLPKNLKSIESSAFAECLFSTITIPDSVNSISGFAFGDCKNLTKITLPKNIKKLKSFIFIGCTNITELIIPENVEVIDGLLFGNETNNLKIISLPEKFTDFNYFVDVDIDDNFKFFPAFAGCENLEIIKFNCTTVKDWNFYVASENLDASVNIVDSESLKTIEINNNVKNFYLNLTKYPNLTKIIFESIDGWIDINFSEKPPMDKVYIKDTWIKNLTTITIPSGSFRIRKNSFIDCTNITSLILPINYCFIEKLAFSGCTGLTKIYINENISVNSKAFEGCTGIKEVHSSKELWFSLNHENYNTTLLASATSSSPDLGLYLDNNLVTDIVIPDDIFEIKDYCFAGYKRLESVKLSKNTVRIGKGAFQGCENLVKIVIPKGSLKSIGEDAFYGCNRLASIYIIEDSENNGESIETTTPTSPTDGEIINSGSNSGLNQWLTINFENKYSNPLSLKSSSTLTCLGHEITRVNISNSCTKIKNYTFAGYLGLKSITFHDNIIEFGIGSFEGTGITDIIIPPKITTISPSCFKNCTKLTTVSVTQTNTIVNFDLEAFSGCSALKTFPITELTTATYIGSNAFNECGLETIPTLSLNKLKRLKDSCLKGLSIINLDFSNNEEILEFPEKIFSENTTLKTIKFPTKLNIIKQRAFYKCTGLTTLSFPSTLKEIQTEGFWGCTSLTSITLNSKVILGYRVFEGCNKLNLTSTNFSNIDTFEEGAFNDTLWYNNQTNNSPIIINNELIKYKGTCSGKLDLSGYSQLQCIGKNSFKGQTGLTSIEFPGLLRIIDESAFEGCTGLKTISNINYLNKIGDRAFYGCSSLEYANIIKEIVIGKDEDGYDIIDYISDITDIGAYAFAGCENLCSLGKDQFEAVFPGNILEIAPGTFQNCKQLIFYAYEGQNLSLRKIGEKAFDGCTLNRLKQFFQCLPNLEELGPGAFINQLNDGSKDSKVSITCSFEESKNIKSIGDNFFSIDNFNYCEVNFDFSNSKTIPKLGRKAWVSVHSSNFKVIVPQGLYYEWIEQPGWKDYKDYIIAYDGETANTLPPTKPEKNSFKYTILKTNTGNTTLNDKNRELNLEVYNNLKELYKKSTRYFSKVKDNGNESYGVYIYKLSPTERIQVEYETTTDGVYKTWDNVSYLVFWSESQQADDWQSHDPKYEIGMNVDRGIQLIPIPEDKNEWVNILSLFGEKSGNNIKAGDLVCHSSLLKYLG